MSAFTKQSQINNTNQNNNPTGKPKGALKMGSLLFKAIPHKRPMCVETAQASIPITTAHDKYNIIEPYEGCYTKSYAISNINYQTASEDEQDTILTHWRAYLNSLGANTEMALTVFNRPVNMAQFQEDVLLKETGDGYDHLRRDMNKVLMQRIMSGKNGITRDEFITLGIQVDNIKKATEVFKRLDSDTDKHLKMIGSSARILPIEERLEVLHDIYNIDNRGEFLTKTKIISDNGRMEEVNSFDFENIRSQGLTVNDVIAPSALVIEPTYIEVGQQYARVLRVTGFPAILSDNFFSDLTSMPFNMLTTLNVKPINNANADALVNQQIAYIREEKHNLQQANTRNNVDKDMINPNIIEREEEVLNLRDEMRKNDEHLFEVTLTMVVFALDMTTLDDYTDTVVSECKKASVVCEVLKDQQEEGFNSTLPLCCNMMRNPRTLKSSSVAILAPFSNLDINEHDGINYSMNAVSRNLLVYNRENKANFNGFVLGSSGSGKSFIAKTEIVNVFLKKTADFMIIDPEQEYVYITTKLGGQVIPIMPGGQWHINPLDISTSYEFDDASSSFGEIADPILEKVSFIMKLFESMLNKSWGMDSVQKTLIDECLRDLYSPFMKDGRLYRAPEREETPTLNDMMDWFAKSKEPEARELFFTLKRYAGQGTLNIFSQPTNIDIHNRIVCFDISAVGDELKLMAMNIIQDAIWSRLVENRRINKFTYIYIDEIHLYFQPGSESSAEFLVSLFKRARKYNGVCTGITQNTADMVDSPIAKKMISECNFIQVLNQQSDESRERLKNTLNLSESSLDYITSAPPGQGLLYSGSNTVPFFSVFPKINEDGTRNMIYPLLTSNASELANIREIERRERLEQEKEARKLSYEVS